jgi:hypothetical protein
MTAAELLSYLSASGVTLFVRDGRLRFRARSADTYTPAMRQAVAGCRRELVSLLTLARLDHWQEMRERYLERAAIREYDGGFPRALAEALALADVFAEETGCTPADERPGGA